MVKISKPKVLRTRKSIMNRREIPKEPSVSEEELSSSDEQAAIDLPQPDAAGYFDLSDAEDDNKEGEGQQKNSMEINSDESDFELQVALREGILQKNGLNVLQEGPKQKINKKQEMVEKLAQFQKKRKFIDTLAVTFSPELSYVGSVNSDFEREAAFMKQAQDAVAVALPKLHSLNVPIFRPDDYFAEMAKSDLHMHKVRHRILDVQKDKEQREASRRMREEKRFAVKVQGAAEERKRKEKRKLLEAVKKHRKGMKGQLEQMLNNASKMQLDDDEDGSSRGNFRKSGKSRTERDKKYGYGGKKKNAKRNDKNSFENPFSANKRPQQKFNKKGRGKRAR